MRGQVVAHVGYHKTGSTLLQRQVFVEEHGFYAPWPIRFHTQSIVRPNPYRAADAALEQVYGEALQLAWRNDLVPVISHEALLGHPFDGGNRYATTAHVERLASAFPDLHVLVVIREQASMLASLYKQGVTASKTWDVSSFLARDDGRRGSFALEFLEYSWPLLHLRTLLGPHRLTVLPYEQLSGSPEAFAAHLGALTGRPIPTGVATSQQVNEGLTALEARLQGLGNRFLPNDPCRRASWSAHLRRASQASGRVLGTRLAQLEDQRVMARIDSVVGSRYADSNAAVEQAFGLDLAGLGYRT